MTRSGNRGWRPYLAILAALAVAVSGSWALAVMRASAATASTPTWSTLSPPQKPPALAYGAEAFDPANQTTVLFGGVDPTGSLSGNTWIWNGTTWSEAPAQVSGPAPRELASLAYFPGVAGQTQGQLILFGGEGAGGTPLGDTWAWNGQSWVAMATAPTASPGARFGASLAVDAAGNLVLFGGTGSNSILQRPMDAAPSSSTSPSAASSGSSAAPSTTQASASAATMTGDVAGAAVPSDPASTPTTSPPSTAAAAQAVSDSSASPSATTTLSDTWIWNGSAWSQPNITSGPPPRTDAALVWDPAIGQTVLFGGSATPTAGGSASPIGDTWVWSGSAWTQVHPGTSPPARYDAASGSAGTIGGDLLVGGNGGSGQLSDAWSFSGATWSPLHTAGALTARSGAAAAGNPAASELMTFGGVGSGGNLDDTDVLTPAPPLQVTPSSSPSQGSAPGGSPPSSSGGNGAGSSQATAGHPGSAPSSTTASPAGGGPAPSTSPTSAAAPVTSTVPATTPATVGMGTGARIGQQPQAGAQTNPRSLATGQQGLTTSPPMQTVHTGSLVTVLGSGFEPGAMVTITFHSRPYTVGRTIAGPQGTFAATVTVPLNASPGHHHLEASGMGPHGKLTVLLTPLLVLGSAAHASGGTPTRTKLIMVAVSVLLPIGTWVFLGVWSRRRRRPVAAP